ncbi:MAG: DUF4350 domain-containing protein [Gammaproteobacteria bacterium]|nr:DUF4350 domain-containing protein [Gammaproteobacteria bacterium]
MPAHTDQILTRQSAALLILIGGAAFCAVLVLLVLVDPTERTVTKPSSYSRSAVGHAALASLLRGAGYSVQVNRSRQARGIADDDLLLVLEPDLDLNTVADLQRLMKGEHRVLVALPKWRQQETGLSPGMPRGWIEGATLLEENTAGKVARGVIVPAKVERPETAIIWTDRLGLGSPEIGTPQMIVTGELRPLVASSQGGILIGEVPVAGRAAAKTVLLADPDLIANHGLHRGNNARLVLGLIERMLPSTDATIHFDESLHGFAIVPSLPRLLLAPPFLAATLLALGAIAVVVWRAAAGFGSYRPSSDGTPVFGSGHETLLRNAGRLLAAGDHAAYIADRYGVATLEEAARRLHVGHRGSRASNRKETELRGILQGVASRRGVRTRLPGTGDLRPLVKARRYYDWMEEVFGGSRPGRNTR